jgi:hypothetical protein
LLRRNHFRPTRSKLNRRREFKLSTIPLKLMRNLRTHSIGTQLTDQELATVVAACPEPILSEWIRRGPDRRAPAFGRSADPRGPARAVRFPGSSHSPEADLQERTPSWSQVSVRELSIRAQVQH